MLPQTQSLFFSLPGELRNSIANLALTPSNAIVNPHWERSNEPDAQKLCLGTAFLRSCRAVYLETDSSQLLKHVDFVFTRVTHMQSFFSRLSMSQASHIHKITIDLREAASGDATQNERSTTIANEWIHYLCCTQGAHSMGAWCSHLSTLQSDLPHLRSLCVDLTKWQPKHAGHRVNGWKYLRSLLAKSRALDSITLKSRCLDSKLWSFQPVPWSLGRWFSPALDKDDSALVDLMGRMVREEGENELKILQWRVLDGITVLTVRVAGERVAPAISSHVSLSDSGNMLWAEFIEFKGGQARSLERRKSSLSGSEIMPARAWEILA